MSWILLTLVKPAKVLLGIYVIKLLEKKSERIPDGAYCVQLDKFPGMLVRALLLQVIAVTVQSQVASRLGLPVGVLQATPRAVPRCKAKKNSRLSATTRMLRQHPNK